MVYKSQAAWRCSGKRAGCTSKVFSRAGRRCTSSFAVRLAWLQLLPRGRHCMSLSAAASGGSAYGKELPGPIRPRCLSMLAASKSHVAHIRVGDQFSIVMNSIRTLNCETGRFFGESERHICIVDYLASAILASFSGGCVGFPFGWRSAAMAGSWQATPSGVHIETNYFRMLKVR
jgi:hypothetical protein